MEQKLLDYAFDEERTAFGAPISIPRTTPVTQRVAVAVIAVGGVAWLLQAIGGVGLATWGGILSSYGLIAVGAIALFRLRFGGSVPGIKQDDTFFRNAQNRGLIGWGLGILITGFYVALYFQDDLIAWGLPAFLARPIRMLDPLAQTLSGAPANRWFLYGFLYTTAVLVFGARMLLKYPGNRYQQIRTASVMFFQLGFAFVIPNLLKALNQPEFYFTYFWPLKPEYACFPAKPVRCSGF